MRIIEFGDIGDNFGESLFEDICEAVNNKGGWRTWNIAEIVRDELVRLCKSKLPKTGFTIEATEEEVSNAGPFCGAEDEVSLVKKGS